jgi:hypothetical protein
LRVSIQYLLQKLGIGNFRIFKNVARLEKH